MVLMPTRRFGGDPFAEMRRLQADMNRMFSEWGGAGPAGAAREDFPPVNVWVGEHSVVVTAQLPGFAEDDLDLTVRDDSLTLRGSRKPPELGETSAWHRRERAYGEFARVVELPLRVDPQRVEARFANGVLTVELHRPEADRPRKIRITAS